MCRDIALFVCKKELSNITASWSFGIFYPVFLFEFLLYLRYILGIEVFM